MPGPSNFTKAQAVMMIQNLSVDERKMFLKELKKVARSRDGGVAVPSSADLRQLAYHNSLPFVGFGFLDNFVMIIAGEYIELSLGMKLGISTMAAAALGNTISDLVGIGSAWYVESFAHKLGKLASCDQFFLKQINNLYLSPTPYINFYHGSHSLIC